MTFPEARASKAADTVVRYAPIVGLTLTGAARWERSLRDGR